MPEQGPSPAQSIPARPDPPVRMPSRVRVIRGWLPRAAAVLAEVAAAFFLRELVARNHPGFAPFITFYPAVLLASLLDGAIAGIAVTSLAVILADLWVFPPYGLLAIEDPYDILAMGIFFSFGVALSIVVELYHRNRERLASVLVEEALFEERKFQQAERAIAESVRAERQRLLDVMEALPAMVSLRRPDHLIPFANRSFRDRFGDPAGRKCHEMRYGRSEPCPDCETFEPLKTGQPGHREVVFPDSSRVEVYDFPFTDLDGSSLVLEMGLDVTERRRAEAELVRHREHLEELVVHRTRQWEAVNVRLEKELAELAAAEREIRESGAKLEAALASMTDSVVIADAQGRFVEFNDAFAAFYRYKTKAQCPRNFAAFSAALEVFTAAGDPLPLDMYPLRRALRGESGSGVEFSYRRKDTGETWIGSLSFGPIRDLDGTITGAVISAHDITQRKLADAQLADARLRAERTAAQLRTIFDSVEERLYVCDRDGIPIMANDVTRQTYRDPSAAPEAPIPLPSVAEMAGVLEVWDLEGRPLPLDEWPISRALRGEHVQSQEIRVRFKSTGHERILSCNGSAIRDAAGDILMAILTSADITERKRTEAALREGEKVAFQREQYQALAERVQRAREEERTRVARNLHDQIGQILTAIKLDLTWMNRHLANGGDQLQERLKETISLVSDGMRSVRHICKELRPGVLDDLGLAAAIEWQANEFASRTGIDCFVSVPSADIALEPAQATEFFRIFQECLTNVTRHAEAKSVHVTLAEDQGELVLAVADDGKGFDQSDDNSLGFLGMKERAQMAGGSVSIASSPGNGTTVTLRVPARIAPKSDTPYAHSHHR